MLSSELRRMDRRRPRMGLALVCLGGLLVTTACSTPAVTPTSPRPVVYTPGPVMITDTFERIVSDGWGQADLGGDYRPQGRPCLSVRDGFGVMQLAQPSTECQSGLSEVTPGDLTGSVEITVERLPTAGNGLYSGVFLRSNSGYYYQVGLRVGAMGNLFLSLSRFDGSREGPVQLGREIVLPFRAVAGRPLRVRFETTGDTPVKLSASVSPGSSRSDKPNPKARVTAIDDSASRLALGGGFEVWSYSSKSTPGSQTIRFDNLQVRRLFAP